MEKNKINRQNNPNVTVVGSNYIVSNETFFGFYYTTSRIFIEFVETWKKGCKC